MKVLKWALVALVALVALSALPAATRSGSLMLPVVLAAAFVLWRMAAHKFDFYHSVRIGTTAGYLGVAAAMTVLARTENTSATYWMLVGVAFTAIMAVRTGAQERFLSSRDDSWVNAGRGSFAERAYLRTVSPPIFRWLHRIFALWWMWSLVVAAMHQSGPDPFKNFGTVLIPGFVLLLGGPFVALFFIPLFLLALVFLAMMPGLLWVASSILWLIVTSLRTPTDRRTNHYRAFRKATRNWPWYFMT